jgi:hypothetical protein
MRAIVMTHFGNCNHQKMATFSVSIAVWGHFEELATAMAFGWSQLWNCFYLFKVSLDFENIL